MNIAIKAILVLSVLGAGAALAYPGMQPQAQQQAVSTVDKVQLLPKAYPIEAIPFQGADGQSVNFSQYKGKVVMVNMWATWCPPCVRELPSLDKLAHKFSTDDFVVLPISIDAQGQKQVQPFLKSLGMENFHSFYDPKQHLGQVFPLDYIPATFILNKKGDLVAFVRSYVDWNDPKALTLINNLIEQKS
ncbi:alkyl hydroperoxide reductase [Shewanella sp. NFH-SH190041]|uniref:TlpA disulfide reductase family protein n=1 Tax=Shewanella sp. NFH-SH190041 TaxID=2950245 RepID=UPI0021C3E45E|nr:TlpA disulfide reductase family protein [Shewanella sp. NFH-SH190041]BDM66124.1 alkyl hydroperoxide reductase [Shewanella sp. NFH-SH190041]